MIKWVTYLIFGLISFVGYSQNLNTSCSDTNILIGQSIIVKYEVVRCPSGPVKFKPHKDKLPALIKSDSGQLTADKAEFEILIDFIDTTINDNGDITWSGQYSVTVWDSGVFVIPGPKIIVADSTLQFDDIKVKCLLMDAVQGIDIYDIKENYADVPDKPFSILEFIGKNWWWLTLLLAVIIGGIIYWKRKNRPVPVETKFLSLKERTIIAINALEDSKLWEKDRLKEHFVELSYILRQYLTSRYEISLMEKTTEQIRYALLRKGLGEDTIEVIGNILGASDMVKFAKSKPELIEILKVSTLAKQVVAETSPLDFDNDD